MTKLTIVGRVGLAGWLAACTVAPAAPARPYAGGGGAPVMVAGAGPAASTEGCPDGNCHFTCESGQTCAFGCDGGNCHVECLGGSTCSASCNGGNCHDECSGGASCTFDCNGGNCHAECPDGASCELSCNGGNCR